MAADLGYGIQLHRRTVELLQVINRPGQREDRVVLRAELWLRFSRHHPRPFHIPRTVTTELRLTLARDDRRWKLLTIDSGTFSDAALDSPLIPGAWADQDRLWEEALAEMAASDTSHRVSELRDIVPPGLPPAEQLTALGQVDRRFDADLLEARLRRIVEAWELSDSKAENPLLDVATEEVAELLLHKRSVGNRERLILHDAHLDHWTVTEIDLTAAPQIHVAADVSAVAYRVEDRTGKWSAGNADARGTMRLDWTLTLHREPSARWELTATTSPFSGIE